MSEGVQRQRFGDTGDMKPPSVAAYWLPEGINPPCSCGRHPHRSDGEGQCDYATTNDPASWGVCSCQHNALKPVTREKFDEWQRDIRSGRIGPDDNPVDLGLHY